MKEEVLVQLGFNRNDISEEESGASAFYYYTMDFGSLCLISNANDEVGEDGEWMVDKAKEMERMQIKDAYSAGVWEIGCFNRNPDAKKYYEENYQEL